MCMSFDSTKALLGIYPWEALMGKWNDLARGQFITALWKITKMRNNFNVERLLNDKWICKLIARNLHTMERAEYLM